MSLGQALEWVIKLQEKHVKEKQINHLKSVIELQVINLRLAESMIAILTSPVFGSQEKLKENHNFRIRVKDSMQAIHGKYKELSDLDDNRDLDQEFEFRSSRR